MTINESDVIAAAQAFTYLSVQTQSESNSSTNTTASILYNTSSRNQGNFSLYYTLAQEQLAKDLIAYNLTLTDAQKVRAYAFLIQHYFEQKFKSWDAISTSQSGDSISKKSVITSGFASYLTLLRSYAAGGTVAVSTDLEKHTDSENYPEDWKDSQMDIDEIDFEDPA